MHRPRQVDSARRLLLALGALGLCSVGPLRAQGRRVEQLYTADGRRLDYARDAVWRVKARRVAEARARLLGTGQFSELNARLSAARLDAISQAAPNPSTNALEGVLALPTILIAFKNTDTTALARAGRYDSIFYTPVPLTGRSYTLRTFYEEQSHGLFSVHGTTYGWAVADSNSAYYLNACGVGADPLGCVAGFARIRELLVQGIQRAGSIDWSLYDNDGPDGVPNSGDDDGVVDLVQFVQPLVGAECNGPGYNAHHYQISDYDTGSPRFGGGTIVIRYYQLVAGVGGTGCSDNTAIMALGTAAHETGHGLGLPDLYDTGPGFPTEGVGEWSLMGSGNYTSLNSPAHFDAWSLQQMGWVWIVPLSGSAEHHVGAVELSDTVFYARPVGSNPRGEYFLFENKQAQQGDTSNMLTGNPRGGGPKQGGLLIWHVDSAKVAQGMALNEVNSGAIHGLALVQADGLAQLDQNRDAGGNRGDAGDPYPGSSANSRFSFESVPKAVMNSDGSSVGFAVDSIRQIVAAGEMAFRLVFGGLTVVRATDTLAQVTVDGAKYRRFADILADGSLHTVAIDSAQLTPDSLRQFQFQSWSDELPRSHTITGSTAGDSISASVAVRLRVRATITGNGTLTSSPQVADLAAGTFVRGDSSFALQATAAPGYRFDGWTGDTTTTASLLVLLVSKPYTLAAHFTSLTALRVSPLSPAPEAVEGQAFGPMTLSATGGAGPYAWSLVAGALPPGLALSASGEISGTPSDTGHYAATARVTSGSESADVTVDITVYPRLVAAIGSIPSPVMGAHYVQTLTATGGTGAYAWRVQAGVLPTGVTLTTAGVIDGVPSETGRFDLLLRVSSGIQVVDTGVVLTVLAPSLTERDVVSQLLSTAEPLTADQRRYLDLLGNGNGVFDVGDFLAWLAQGADSAAAVAVRAGPETIPQPAGRRRVKP